MSYKEELLHHILPATAGTSLMVGYGEHLFFSVLTGVLIWIITKALSMLLEVANKNKTTAIRSSEGGTPITNEKTSIETNKETAATNSETAIKNEEIANKK